MLKRLVLQDAINSITERIIFVFSLSIQNIRIYLYTYTFAYIKPKVYSFFHVQEGLVLMYEPQNDIVFLHSKVWSSNISVGWSECISSGWFIRLVFSVEQQPATIVGAGWGRSYIIPSLPKVTFTLYNTCYATPCIRCWALSEKSLYMFFLFVENGCGWTLTSPLFFSTMFVHGHHGHHVHHGNHGSLW